MGVGYASHTRGFGITPLDMAHTRPPLSSLVAATMQQMKLKSIAKNNEMQYLSHVTPLHLLITCSTETATI